MTDPQGRDITELAAEDDLLNRLAVTIGDNLLNETSAKLLALQLIGGVDEEQPIGKDNHGEIDILTVTDANIDTASIGRRLEELAPNSYFANGTAATRPGLIVSARSSDPDLGPALDPEYDYLLVDSFDRMKSEHQVAFEEILNTRTYSIANDKIRDTLEASGTFLFFGQPKYGSFDLFDPIGDQIDYSPSILTAVDYVVAVTESEDLSGTRLTPSTAKDVVRKARDIHPEWYVQPQAALSDYVDELTSLDDENNPYSAPEYERVYQSLRKLSEAIAKIRLSDAVEISDVDRAWDLTKSSYASIGISVEDFHYEQAESETEKERKTVEEVRGIIADIESEFDHGAPITEVVNELMDEGYSRAKAESEIETLKQKGEAYEPRTDYLRVC